MREEFNIRFRQLASQINGYRQIFAFSVTDNERMRPSQWF